MFVFNKITAIVLSIALVAMNLNAGIVSQTCKYSGETNFFPVGDQRGNTLLIKKEIHRDCNVTISAQGSCKKWEDKHTKFFLDPSQYNTYKTNNYNGTMGSMLAAVGAYNQIGHMWSGWHGYCQKGLKYDFSWASNPMFWASLAMSTVMGGSEKGGFLHGTSADFSKVTSSTGSAWQSLGAKVGLKLSENFGTCLVSAGVDMSKNLYNYFSGSSKQPCDPVDDFCNKQNKPTENDIMTVDQTQYNALIAQNPKYANYIEILGSQKGILTIVFKPMNKMTGVTKKSQEQLKKMRDKIKTVQFEISSALVATKMAACGLSSGKFGGTPSVGNSVIGKKFSVKEGIGIAINAFPASWLGPYGSLIKAALTVALQFATSFKHINSCDNKTDAQAAGSRDLKTYESLPYGLCQLTETSCAQKNFIGSGCGLHAFHYCCYDQVLTKDLVAQIKAELGRDWAHCTGITLRDLNFVSFRQCTAADKKAGFDGTKIVLKYNANGKLVSPAGWTDSKWLDSYQHKRKCIDLGPFKKYLQSKFSQNIDFKDFNRIFSDTKNQINPLP